MVAASAVAPSVIAVAALAGGAASTGLSPRPLDDRAVASRTPAVRRAVVVAARGSSSCAVTAASTVKCWGGNSLGQLGDGTDTRRPKPVTASGVRARVAAGALALGGAHTCAVTAAGGAKCWGFNHDGELGNGTRTESPRPVDVSDLGTSVIAITAGSSHTCALTAEGGVKCWGDNAYGQLGGGATRDSLSPLDVPGLGGGVTAIAAGGAHTCALTADGTVTCWGANSRGQLGDGTTRKRPAAVDVVSLGGRVSALAAGQAHICALTADGGVKCWGANNHGQLGDGTTRKRSRPISVVGLQGRVASLAAGEGHTCALLRAGIVKCWGLDSSGQLGDAITGTRLPVFRPRPVRVAGLGGGISAVAAGGEHSCALSRAGRITCWGGNGVGELGDGTEETTRLTPVGVLGFGRSGKCVVPNVKRRTLSAATVALERARCSVGNISADYSRTLERGRVISQQPAPGTTRLRRHVTLVVSIGTLARAPIHAWSARWLAGGGMLEVYGSKGSYQTDDADSLWLMRADGTHRRVLVDNYLYQDSVELAVPSPSARALAHAYSGPGRVSLRIGVAGQKRTVTLPAKGWAYVDDIVWEPHERAVAVAVSTEPYSGPERYLIFVVDLSSGRVRLLTGRSSQHSDPVWAPDGQRLAFRRCRGSTCRIAVARPDGSGRLVLPSSGRSYSVGRPVWAPDGRAIAFTRCSLSSHCQLVLSRLGGGHGVLLRYGDEAGPPVWSPDGRTIAFARAFGPEYRRTDPGRQRWAIYAVRLDGTQRRLTRTSFLTTRTLTPAWSPDSRSIAFADGAGISIVDVAGHTQRRVTGLGKTESDWPPLAWAPSPSIAFVHEGDVYTWRPGSTPTRVVR